jgi:ribosomal protein L16/L10AE
MYPALNYVNIKLIKTNKNKIKQKQIKMSRKAVHKIQKYIKKSASLNISHAYFPTCSWAE